MPSMALFAREMAKREAKVRFVNVGEFKFFKDRVLQPKYNVFLSPGEAWGQVAWPLPLALARQHALRPLLSYLPCPIPPFRSNKSASGMLSGQGGLLPRGLEGQDQASWQRSPLCLGLAGRRDAALGGTLARWGALPKGKRLGQSPPSLANGAAH